MATRPKPTQRRQGGRAATRPRRSGVATRPAIRPAAAADAPRIAEIYNLGIAERGATFETTPRTAADMARRLAPLAEDAERYPLLVVELEGAVAGWAAIAPYRPRACYAGIGEFSIYLDRASRGRGLGRLLLAALIREASRRGYWKLVSRIFPSNAASLALCRSCGFREVGRYEKHARLDGRWLDVVIVERLIPENQPEAPVAAAGSGGGGAAVPDPPPLR